MTRFLSLATTILILLIPFSACAKSNEEYVAELRSQVEEALGKSVIELACGRADLLELDGVDPEACERRSDQYLRRCWKEFRELPIGIDATDALPDDVPEEFFELMKSAMELCLTTGPRRFTSAQERAAYRERKAAERAEKDQGQTFKSWLEALEATQKETRQTSRQLDQLISKFESSGYESIINPLEDKFFASIRVDGEMQNVTDPADSTEWLSLMQATNTLLVANTPRGIQLTKNRLSSPDHEFFVSINAVSDELPACSRDYSFLRCGACQEPIATGRFMTVGWFPAEFMKSDDEKIALTIQACVETGVEEARRMFPDETDTTP